MLPAASRMELERIIGEIQDDRAALQLLAARAATLLKMHEEKEPDEFMLRAAGSILHDFYNGVEAVLCRVADEINGGVPRGAEWHVRLLQDMTLDLPGIRPAVMSRETRTLLDKFRGFRHRFRHTYGISLEWPPIKELLEKMPVAVEKFGESCDNINDYLKALIKGAQPHGDH